MTTLQTEIEMDPAKLREVDDYIDSLPDGLGGKESSLIMTLHKAQDVFGFLSEQLQSHIAHRLNIPASKVYGVVTFYSFFNIKPKGKYQISVCMGTACFVRGAQTILEKFQEELSIGEGETTEDGLFSLDSIRCVGACGLAPVVTVNGQVFGRVTPEDVKTILEKFMAEV